MSPSKDQIQNLLREGVCKVTFTKVDGSRRVLNGTLHEDWLDAETLPYDTDHKTPDHIVPLYDVDQEHWKSFRIDSLLMLETNNEVHLFTDPTNLTDPYLHVPREEVERVRQGKDFTIHIRT